MRTLEQAMELRSSGWRGLSLTQPWATLVAVGAKRIETRSWWTAYRGPLAIHAAKEWPRAAIELCMEEPFASTLREKWPYAPSTLPRGAIIASARLAGCIKIPDMRGLVAYPRVAEHEQAFGDYAPGRYMWLLADVQRLLEPIPCNGALGLWMVPPEIAGQLPRAA